MTRNNLTTKAFKHKIYAKFGDEFIRTIPAKGVDAPYIGYIKTTIGEAKVPFDSEVLHEVMTSGEEIMKKDYEKAILTSVNSV